MKRSLLFFVLLMGATPAIMAQQPVRTPPMRLTSTAFADGAIIPSKYTQASPDGGISPELAWTNAPAGTQSFVLWMHDVDVAVNKTSEDNLHWLVWNIPGQSTGLPENQPKGQQLADGSYQLSYAGPSYRGPGAPAAGPRHHYVFELFALDIKPSETPAATALETKTNVFKMMQGHILGKAAYVGLFKRPQ
jgi:Raf kinase inhibitor-like YbhB/YbcL family protein